MKAKRSQHSYLNDRRVAMECCSLDAVNVYDLPFLQIKLAIKKSVNKTLIYFVVALGEAS